MSNCIEHAGHRNPKGYGQVRHKGKMEQAHRVAYCEHHGVDIESIRGIIVRHRCDNPPCKNPEHLELGDESDNMQDRKRNDGVFHKLRQSDADAIRAALAAGSRVVDLCKRYGVGRQMIYKIKKGLVWV